MKIEWRKPGIHWLVLVLAPMSVILAGYIGVALSTGDRGGEGNPADRRMATELATLIFPAASLAERAAVGDARASAALDQLIQRVDSLWVQLRTGSTSIAPERLDAFEASWRPVKTAADILFADKDSISTLRGLAGALAEALPRVQDAYAKLMEALIAAPAPADQVLAAHAQSLRAEKIGRNLDRLFITGASGDAMAPIDQLARDLEQLGRVGVAMRKGDAVLGITPVSDSNALQRLATIDDLERTPLAGGSKIAVEGAALARAHTAAREIAGQLPTLLAASAQLYVAGAGQSAADEAYRTVYASLALIAGLLLLGLVYYLSTRTRLHEATAASQANQQAILRLLDEIEGIGEGDLIVQATVTEDFTGAIADSINSTIAQLRELVSRIVETAENVSSSANDTRATALQLCEASEHQAQEITGASVAINEMAVSIDQVSTNAADSAVVAQRSVSIANKGAAVVRDTIKGMDGIREQIQDTSKRIKRLGESSQQIGDIVSLINDIADQTNILALNAAIQAAMAGDAGRGFAVVADEVQRLAERSASATKQIAALVRTIQTDAMEAVSSMEQTTAEVVAGAALTQNAGVALGEIETVSSALAQLIEDISTLARRQSATAGHIAKTMNVIQDITSQTLAGSTNTASSVGYLAEMAIELRESVSGFKLPGAPSAPARTGGGQAARMTEKAAVKSAAATTYATDKAGSVGPAQSTAAGLAPAQQGVERRLRARDAPGRPTPEMMGANPVPGRFTDAMAETSAALAAMDAVAAEAGATLSSSPGPIPSAMGAGGRQRSHVEQSLEAELAGINLDEFDLEADGFESRKLS